MDSSSLHLRARQQTPSSVAPCSAVGPSPSSSSFIKAAAQLLADYSTECLQELPSHSSSFLSTRQRHDKAPGDVAGENDEDEEAVLLIGRSHRVQRLAAALEEMTTAQATHAPKVPGAGGRPYKEESLGGEILNVEVRYGSCAVAYAVNALQDCLAALRRTSPASVATNSTSAAKTTATRICSEDMLPLLSGTPKPLPLSEAALGVFALNTRTVFRKKQLPAQPPGKESINVKRPREGEEGSAPPPHCSSSLSSTFSHQHSMQKDGAPSVDVFTEMAEQQRTQRFAIYSSRRALLPRLDRLEAALHGDAFQRQQQREGEFQPDRRRTFYVSPAIRELSVLNLAAERAMLCHTWAVRTKAMLLAKLPSLHEAITKHSETLGTLLYGEDGYHGNGGNQSGEREPVPQGRSSAAGKHSQFVAPYLFFLFCDEGVVRVSIQHGLLMDVTYNLLEKRWTLLRLQWNLWAPLLSVADDVDVLLPAADDISGDTGLHTTHGDGEGSMEGEADPSLGLRCLVPNHHDAMVRYVQSHLSEDGLEGGCLAANHLLCTVTMDVVAAQARRLQRTVFAHPLPARACTLEVRQGTHVSLIVGAPVTAAGKRQSIGEGERVLMLKFRIVGGTVVVERTWTGGGGESGCHQAATDVREVRRVLTPERASSTDGNGRVVVDVESALWSQILGSSTEAS